MVHLRSKPMMTSILCLRSTITAGRSQLKIRRMPRNFGKLRQLDVWWYAPHFLFSAFARRPLECSSTNHASIACSR
ncbi:hypothetical protein BD310DRAFT_938622 [Dichomitus squalens]|uniref:Uncharacterized protein n=1 Tax=Dichomitus squalens TaxID=114155 RepID=A0A4Q9PHK4_9APHY|nr:hypothetical protein BD310DRAFT_938622 [Dichomitus squalens]